MSWLHGVIVPEHVACHVQLLELPVHVPCVANVLHAAGVPEHVPPTLPSAAAQVHPSAWHCVW
jgi:hypothetical protein